MNMRQMLGALLYDNYRAQRLRTPEIEPDRWRKVYGDAVDSMELQFQNEQKQESGIERHFREEREQETTAVLSLTDSDVEWLHEMGVTV